MSQGKQPRHSVCLWPYAFGGRFLRPNTFGTSAFVVRFLPLAEGMPSPLGSSFGKKMRLRRKSSPSAEEERTTEIAEVRTFGTSAFSRTPLEVRERRRASVEISGIKIERTRVKVRTTAEREFERANWAVTPPRRHGIQAGRGQSKCRTLGNLDRRRKELTLTLTLAFSISHPSELATRSW